MKSPLPTWLEMTGRGAGLKRRLADGHVFLERRHALAHCPTVGAEQTDQFGTFTKIICFQKQMDKFSEQKCDAESCDTGTGIVHRYRYDTSLSFEHWYIQIKNKNNRTT